MNRRGITEQSKCKREKHLQRLNLCQHVDKVRVGPYIKDNVTLYHYYSIGQS